MPWTPRYSGPFQRDLRRFSKEVKSKVDTAVEELLKAEDPRRVGHGLHPPWLSCYAYEIGLRYRIIYRPDFKEKMLEFLRVGTHKVY